MCQSLCAPAAGNDPKIDLRLAKRSALASYTEVASQSQLASTAETVAINHCDYRLGESIDRRKQRSCCHYVALHHGCATGKLGNISACDECFVSCASKYNYTDRVVIAQLVQQRCTLLAGLYIQRISLVRTINRDDSNAIATF